MWWATRLSQGSSRCLICLKSAAVSTPMMHGMDVNVGLAACLLVCLFACLRVGGASIAVASGKTQMLDRGAGPLRAGIRVVPARHSRCLLQPVLTPETFCIASPIPVAGRFLGISAQHVSAGARCAFHLQAQPGRLVITARHSAKPLPALPPPHRLKHPPLTPKCDKDVFAHCAIFNS